MNVPVFLTLFSVLLNVDNFFLATAYRWQGVNIGWQSNLLIAGLSGLFTEVAILAAKFTKSEMAGFELGEYSEIVGRGILVMIGVWTLVGYFRAKFIPRSSDSSTSIIPGTPCVLMQFKEAGLVGTALAVDNLGPSFAFGLVNSTSSAIGLTLSTLIFLVSIISVSVGQVMGARSQNRLQGLSPKFVAGCLLLGIALLDPGDAGFNRLLPFAAH